MSSEKIFEDKPPNSSCQKDKDHELYFPRYTHEEAKTEYFEEEELNEYYNQMEKMLGDHRKKKEKKKTKKNNKPKTISLDDHLDEIVDNFSFTNYEYKEPLHNQSIDNGEDSSLVPVSSINSKFRSIFPWKYFNKMQSAVFKPLYLSDNNIVISSPTASGKTVCFELSILRVLESQQHIKEYQNRMKIIYISPIKALCQERIDDWKRKFSQHDIVCVEVTGDTEKENQQFSQIIYRSDIILTTPEKWDSITRNAKEAKQIVDKVALFLIDEVHLLNEDRGATLESIVSRMKTLSFPRKIRFIALSATIPNLNDIGEWIEAKPSYVFHFGEEYRPIPLDIHVLGYRSSKNDFMFDKSLNYKLQDVINTYSDSKPTIIFCSSRKGACSTASFLANSVQDKYIIDHEHKRRLNILSSRIKGDKVLSECILKGIAYHHAGMEYTNRSLIEQSFATGKGIIILFSTSTLAQGINLPAHLIIIKSTSQWRSGLGQVEYDPLSIQQMIGRAGRPQFGEERACAVIMTKSENKKKYENLVKGKTYVESNLHKTISEHLNAEIVAGNITDVSVALSWMKSSFFYVRAKKNPKKYGLSTSRPINTHLHEMCLDHLRELAKYNFIKISDDGMSVEPLELGRFAARYFIAIDTVKSFSYITPKSNMEDILKLISGSKEFEQILLRRSEKKELNSISNKIRFPIDKIQTASDKVNCLIQSVIGRLKLEEYALTQEANQLLSVGIRILKCLKQYLIDKKYFLPLKCCLLLIKIFKHKIWENSDLETIQIEKIGPTYASLLAKAGIKTIYEVSQTNPRQLEIILNRNPPFGNEILQSVNKIPMYDIEIKESSQQNVYTLSIILKRKINQTIKIGRDHAISLLLGIQGNIIFYKQMYANLSGNLIENKVQIPLKNTSRTLNIVVINEEYIGVDIEKTYHLPSISQFRNLLSNNNNTYQMKKQKTIEIDDFDFSLNFEVEP